MTDAFMKSLFGGVIAESLVFPFPELLRAEADQVLGILDGLRKSAAKNVDPARIDRDASLPREAMACLADVGAFGLLVPKDKGGSGLGLTGYARAMQEVASIDMSLALTLSAHESLAVAAILFFGTEAMKARWLPRLASGEVLAAFALAETGAGSDAASIQTRADLDGDAWVLTGEKRWVTNGGVADVFVVFARTSPADDGAKPKLTAFLVERDPRVRPGTNEEKLGVRGASTTTVTFDGVRVPAESVLGEVGRGFKVAMEVLTHARLSLAAACVGTSKRLLKMCVERVGERRTFGRSIAEFGFIRDKIALITADVFAAESMTYLTTGLVDRGASDFTVESAICKVFASEALWRVANEAQQIAGGLGFSAAHAWERLLRDARAPMVFEGTNEILRAFIALSGMQGPSLQIEEVSKAMREPIKGFGLLSELAIKKARSALGRERLSAASPVLVRESAIFDEYTGHLARSVDKVLKRHGKNIAEMQYTQKRIADVAIDLYALAAVISRTSRAIERRGEEGARREIDLTTVFASAVKKRLADNIASFDDNDDELRKAIAQKTCADGGYPLDIV